MKSQYKGVIIDDEPKSRSFIASVVKRECPRIQVVGVAENIQLSKEIIELSQPDILFLDIKLQNDNAFDLLSSLTFKNFKIIFITGYEHYAIEAMNLKASAYLLKPLDISDLVNKVNEIIDELDEGNKQQQSEISSNKIIINQKNGTNFINLIEILYFKAEGRYTWVFLKEGDKIFSSTNLGKYEETITQSSKDFYRTHHSYLVNIQEIVHINNVENQITLKNGDQIPVSVRRKPALTKLLHSL